MYSPKIQWSSRAQAARGIRGFRRKEHLESLKSESRLSLLESMSRCASNAVNGIQENVAYIRTNAAIGNLCQPCYDNSKMPNPEGVPLSLPAM